MGAACSSTRAAPALRPSPTPTTWRASSVAIVRARYDLVFVDPRGVGESSPLDCLSDRDLDAALASDPTPDDAAEIAAYRTGSADFGAGCRQKSGDLSAHVSTEEAARDFDIVRGLLGAKTFDFFGGSYGSQLGATYAALFPTNVGRMVLDGGIDISLTGPELALGQSEGFGRALRAYIKDCLSAKDCPLGRDVATAEGKLSDLLETADATPLRTGESRRLTEGLMKIGLSLTALRRGLSGRISRALSSRRSRATDRVCCGCPTYTPSASPTATTPATASRRSRP